jgi:mRNA-degrading endonuclease toxin of MazEF toxin-antitoxin module
MTANRQGGPVTTANEITNEARDIATSPSVSPGSQPNPLVLGEHIRNLATLLAELAARVEELEARGS